MKVDIGYNVPVPKQGAEDKHCPFYGGLKLRGRTFLATVVASKVPKTATVKLYRRHYLPKYQRFEKRESKIRVHNPTSLNAKDGDEVRIAECRPISKTKRFVIIQILNEEAKEVSKSKKAKVEVKEEEKSEN
jgi:small subunit ribosomal protein S17